MKMSGLLPTTLLLLFFLPACSGFSISIENSTSPPPTASPLPTRVTPTQDNTPAPAQNPTPLSLAGASFKHQWAESAVSNLENSQPELAVGLPDSKICEDTRTAWTDLEPDKTSGEFFLELSYNTPVIPALVHIYQSGSPGSIIRVELLSSSSGLSTQIYSASPAPSNPCLQTLSLPVEAGTAFDRLIITLQASASPTLIDAVELVGTIPGWVNLPILWRIPIPSGNLLGRTSLPGGMAADDQANLYLANGRHGLFLYDAQGSLLKRFDLPTAANLSDIALDPSGRLIVSDTTSQGFIILDSYGAQVNNGGQEFYPGSPGALTLNPRNGSIYLLDQGEQEVRIQVYRSQTANPQRKLPLEAEIYHGLAVDSDGRLFSATANQPLIQKIDPVTGEILDSLGYTELAGSTPRDLALDSQGSIYVLLDSSPDGSAVYSFDRQGTLTGRIGQLVSTARDSQPGFFYQPSSIAVTADGQRLFVSEPGYLTAYLLNR